MTSAHLLSLCTPNFETDFSNQFLLLNITVLKHRSGGTSLHRNRSLTIYFMLCPWTVYYFSIIKENIIVSYDWNSLKCSWL